MLPQLKDYIDHLLFINDISPQHLNHIERKEKVRPFLFDFDYPIFDENYKPVLEMHFMNRFYFDGLGSETGSMFKTRMYAEFNELMPYYNQLFEKSELLKKQDILENYSVYEETEQEALQNSEGETNSKSVNEGTQSSDALNENGTNSSYSDTPQSRLATDTSYATNTTNNKAVATAKTSGSSNATGENTSTNVNKMGSNSKAISKRHGNTGMSIPQVVEQYFNVVLDVETMFFNRIHPLLFSTVYDI